MVFASWYTDTVDIYRVTASKVGNITKNVRSQIASGVPCRIYQTQLNGPNMTDTYARVSSTDKLACDNSVDIRPGDELKVTRGGLTSSPGAPERYFAGNPQTFYDPLGPLKTGIAHKEVPLMQQEIIT